MFTLPRWRTTAVTRDGSPGLAYAADRLHRLVAPPVTITRPPAGVRFSRDVAVAMRDGTVLRVNSSDRSPRAATR